MNTAERLASLHGLRKILSSIARWEIVEMLERLSDGQYPFADGRYPLDQLLIVEVPEAMQALLEASAASSGIAIIRDQLVELRCRMPDMDDAVFAIWWPSGSERMHMLAPKSKVSGRA